MKKLFLVSVATAALVGTNGFALAQAPSERPNAPAAQSAPAEKAAPTEKAAPAEKIAPPMNRTEAPAAKSEGGMKGSQADQKMPADKGAEGLEPASPPPSDSGRVAITADAGGVNGRLMACEHPSTRQGEW